MTGTTGDRYAVRGCGLFALLLIGDRYAVGVGSELCRTIDSMKKELGTFLLLVILCVVVSILNPRFLAGANLQNMARLIGAYGIFSIGIGMVIITGGIDLSVC